MPDIAYWKSQLDMQTLSQANQGKDGIDPDYALCAERVAANRGISLADADALVNGAIESALAQGDGTGRFAYTTEADLGVVRIPEALGIPAFQPGEAIAFGKELEAGGVRLDKQL